MIELLLRKYLANIKASNILDVGPGYGDFARIVAQLTGAREITYIDCNPEVLAWQKAECDKINLIAICKQALLTPQYLETLPEIYDIILCQEILEHLSDPDLFLKNLAKKISSQGYIIITVPTKISERWLKLINPNYMRNEKYGHIQEFNLERLKTMFKACQIHPLYIIPTQPHYFISHTWLFGTRMKVDGSTGRILSNDFRTQIFYLLYSWSFRFFLKTNPFFWGKIFPRNYFIIAVKSNENSC